MRLSLVYNRSAGRSEDSPDSIRQQLRRAGHDVRVIESSSIQRDVKLHDPGDLVVVAGGDGTVRTVAMAMIGQPVPIAVLPLGTANNIANALGLPSDAEAIITNLESLTPRGYDVGHLTAPWGQDVFLEGVGFGPFVRSALLLSHPNRDHEFPTSEDKLTRDRGVIEQMVWNYAAQTCSIELDTETVIGDFVAVHVMNLPGIGPQLTLAPDANPRDGYVDVVAIGEAERSSFAAFVGDKAAIGTSPAEFRVVRSRRVRLSWAGAEVHVDDEIRQIDGPGAFDVWVVPGQLTFLSV